LEPAHLSRVEATDSAVRRATMPTKATKDTKTSKEAKSSDETSASKNLYAN
jgi:hypothetical protein